MGEGVKHLGLRVMQAADMGYGISLIVVGLCLMGVGALMPHL